MKDDKLDFEDRQRIINAYLVCDACGKKYGKGRPAHIIDSTWHFGHCDICGEPRDVTEFRDFGYAKDEYYD